MKVIPGAEGWAEAYEYRAGGAEVRFAMNETPAPILHLTLFNPLDDHYGMSPLEAAQASLDVHNAASAWNKALLDNAARPSGALVYSAASGNLSDEQFERLKSELEAHYQGAANAGRPLLLEGGLDWKGLSLSPKDMDFVEAKNIAAREIALSFGVPPMLLGIPGDNTYSNYAEANRAFYRQTVVPLVTRIAASLGSWLGESFGGNLRLAPDLDEVPALSIEREALWKRVGEASFLTDDEKREATGYEPLPASSPTTLLAKYSPDQPRVPAGNSDGGQWTSGGGGEGGSGEEEGDRELLPENAKPVASSIDITEILTGIERIDIATYSLAQTLARVGEIASFTPQPTAQAYGTFVHKLFADAVRLQNLLGDGRFSVEQTWGDVPDAPYGAKGSIRTDVVLRNEIGDIIAIYDVKTGNASLTPARVRELRLKTKTGLSVPIMELHLDRRSRIKCQIVNCQNSLFIC
jgi:HK97 family phage portal protein